MHQPEAAVTRIVRDTSIMAGKPVIRGTRIPVERILTHLAHTPDLGDLLQAYPELTIEDVKAALAYAGAAVAKGDARLRARQKSDQTLAR